jgi:hypothetical protein
MIIKNILIIKTVKLTRKRRLNWLKKRELKVIKLSKAKILMKPSVTILEVLN